MKFILKPSLLHMTLVKIVIALWNQSDVRSLIILTTKRFGPDSKQTSEIWEEIERKVMEKVPSLSLPHFLKEKVSCIIKPIGAQILEWIKFHSKFKLRLNLPSKFCWTPEGTIDRKKTAELLIKSNELLIYSNLATMICYELSCIYCLEDDINKFRNMLEMIKNCMSSESLIISFWSRKLRGRWFCRVSHASVFQEAACWGNKVGAAYFLQKLTPQEREQYLVDTAKFVGFADVLFLLLSEMEEEEQTEYFKNNPGRVLRSFLEFPLQSYFFEIANCVWDYLSVDSFNFVLRNIIDKVASGFKDWNYQMLFREFWQKSPNTLKNSIENDTQNKWIWLLPALLKIKDKDNVKVILKDVTLAAREKLINDEEMYQFCQNSIHSDEWDILEFGIRECFPSKNEMLKFKEEFEQSHWLCSPHFKEFFTRSKQKWDQIFMFPGDSLCEHSKRSAEESECSSSKRVRSLQ